MSTRPNGCIYLDITTIRKVGKIKLTKGVWLEVTDEYSKYSTTLFMNKKSDMPIIMARLLSHWKAMGKPVKIIRCDNAGENKNRKKPPRDQCFSWGLYLNTPLELHLSKTLELKNPLIQNITGLEHVSRSPISLIPLSTYWYENVLSRLQIQAISAYMKSTASSLLPLLNTSSELYYCMYRISMSLGKQL